MNKLQTNIENAINQNADNIGGEEYNNTKTYEEGDIVIYEGQLYVCTTAVETAEEFDSTKWTATNLLTSAGGNEIVIGTEQDTTSKTKLLVEQSTKTMKFKDQTTGNFETIGGDEVVVGDEQDATEDTKLLIESEELANLGSEVVNSLEGNETAKAPSVRAVNDRIIHFDWTPTLNCVTTSEAPTVTYSSRIGHGCKIKIDNNISIVFVHCYITGKITAVSNGNNYATISGLPYERIPVAGMSSFNFSSFYKAVSDSHPIPTGTFSKKVIGIKRTDVPFNGGAVDNWVVSGSNFEITGSGFYFTND